MGASDDTVPAEQQVVQVFDGDFSQFQRFTEITEDIRSGSPRLDPVKEAEYEDVLDTGLEQGYINASRDNGSTAYWVTPRGYQAIQRASKADFRSYGQDIETDSWPGNQFDPEALHRALENKYTQDVFEASLKILTAPNGSKNRIKDSTEYSSDAVDKHVGRLEDAGVIWKHPDKQSEYTVHPAAQKLGTILDEDGLDEVQRTLETAITSYPAELLPYQTQGREDLPYTFESLEHVDWAVDFAKAFFQDDSVTDAKAIMDIGKVTVQKRFKQLQYTEAFDVDGWGITRQYDMDDTFESAVKEYLKTEDSLFTLQWGVRHAKQVQDEQAKQNIWPYKHWPEDLVDIRPQWQELLAFARASMEQNESKSSMFRKAAEYLPHHKSGGAAKSRLETLEEKGLATMVVTDDGAEVYIDDTVKPLIDELDDHLPFIPENVRYDDIPALLEQHNSEPEEDTSAESQDLTWNDVGDIGHEGKTARAYEEPANQPTGSSSQASTAPTTPRWELFEDDELYDVNEDLLFHQTVDEPLDGLLHDLSMVTAGKNPDEPKEFVTWTNDTIDSLYDYDVYVAKPMNQDNSEVMLPTYTGDRFTVDQRTFSDFTDNLPQNALGKNSFALFDASDANKNIATGCNEVDGLLGELIPTK